MKILSTMSLPYEPAFGGANKGNRTIAELLASAGHEVRVVAPQTGTPELLTFDAVARRLREEGVHVSPCTYGQRFRIKAVDVFAVQESKHMRSQLLDQIAEFNPDCVLVSSEEITQKLLAAAANRCSERVVYLLFTPNFLPFGPFAFFPGKKRESVFRDLGAIVATSNLCANYLRKWSSYEAEVYLPPVYGSGPFPDYGASADSGYLTIVNPCRYKGIDIFVQLAKAFPALKFAAVPTWGTTAEDRARLEELPNVVILQPSSNVDDFLSKTRILLVPSLWLENLCFSVTEAMLRGIPVIASDCGGLPEAKLGTGYLIPVRPILRFTDKFDANQLPVPIVPEQDIAPWCAAIEELVSDRKRYAAESALCREAATHFVDGLGISGLEKILERVVAEAANGTVRSAAVRGSKQRLAQ